jgi:multidrug efflux pump subunit AcrB
MSYEEAGLAAGKRRMRPIFLTSSAAAVGVIPMILSGSSLWGPLGTVICFGLLTGMALTLLVLPVLYWKSIGRSEERKSAKALKND